MNEKNIVSIDAVIDRIKIGGYIDCSQTWNYAEDYEYDNILYYLEKYKNLQFKIDKINQYIKEAKENNSCTVLPSGKISDVGYCIDALEDIEDILKEDK